MIDLPFEPVVENPSDTQARSAGSPTGTIAVEPRSPESELDLQRGNEFRDFLWRIAGVDVPTLSARKYRHHWRIYDGIGALILLTTVVFGFALGDIAARAWGLFAFVPGFVVGAWFMLHFERLAIRTISSLSSVFDGSVMVGWRILLSCLSAGVLAFVLLSSLFAPDVRLIKLELQAAGGEQAARKISEEFAPLISAAVTALEEPKRELAELDGLANKSQQAYLQESDGTGGTHHPWCLDICMRKKATADADRARAEELHRRLDPTVARLAGVVDSLRTAERESLSEIHQSAQQSTSVLTDIRALEILAERDRVAAVFLIGMFLLVMACDTTPLIFKWLMPDNSYEREIRAIEIVHGTEFDAWVSRTKATHKLEEDLNRILHQTIVRAAKQDKQTQAYAGKSVEKNGRIILDDFFDRRNAWSSKPQDVN